LLKYGVEAVPCYRVDQSCAGHGDCDGAVRSVDDFPGRLHCVERFVGYHDAVVPLWAGGCQARGAGWGLVGT